MASRASPSAEGVALGLEGTAAGRKALSLEIRGRRLRGKGVVPRGWKLLLIEREKFLSSKEEQMNG